MASPLIHVFFVLFIIYAVTVAHSSLRPISDEEIKANKDACYADIENGLWGWRCRSSAVAKENCALRCVSPECYQLIYESDPLEEGERDEVRSNEFKFCMRKLSVGQGVDEVKSSLDDDKSSNKNARCSMPITGGVRIP